MVFYEIMHMHVFRCYLYSSIRLPILFTFRSDEPDAFVVQPLGDGSSLTISLRHFEGGVCLSKKYDKVTCVTNLLT